MDKEQFEHIERLIRQAAENVSPPVNEEAWKKMEALLDNESGKKRRRAIIWWWPLLLLLILAGGGIYYYQQDKQPVSEKSPNSNHPAGHRASNGVNGKTRNSKPSTRAQKNTSASPGIATNNLPGTAGKNTQKISEELNSGNKGKPGIVQQEITKAVTPKSRKSRAGLKTSYRYRVPVSTTASTTKEHKGNEHIAGKRTLEGSAPDHTPVFARRNIKGPSFSSITDSAKRLPIISPALNPDSTKKPAARRENRALYFLASGSYDASAIKKLKLNSFNLKYGLGIGYHISKRLSLQTGFYAAKKIYTAGDGDYKVKPDSYISKILTVNADCFFYDIPISARYDVLQRKKYSIYAVAGMSSYWSKRETYDYHFLNRNGMYRSMVSTYRNNTDFFSVLNVSAGFEYGITRSFYLHAEPYVNVPVAGLGEGSVMMYSGGLQLGIKYQPLKTIRKN